MNATCPGTLSSPRCNNNYCPTCSTISMLSSLHSAIAVHIARLLLALLSPTTISLVTAICWCQFPSQPHYWVHQATSVLSAIISNISCFCRALHFPCQATYVSLFSDRSKAGHCRAAIYSLSLVLHIDSVPLCGGDHVWIVESSAHVICHLLSSPCSVYRCGAFCPTHGVAHTSRPDYTLLLPNTIINPILYHHFFIPLRGGLSLVLPLIKALCSMPSPQSLLLVLPPLWHCRVYFAVVHFLNRCIKPVIYSASHPSFTCRFFH